MEEKLCNTIQEFEDIFGNVPFKDLDKIKKHIKNNFIPISLIEKKIEELNKQIKEFKINFFKVKNEIEKDYWRIELTKAIAKRNILQEILDERNNTDD